MTTEISAPAWDSLSYAEKNHVLFERQKHMLEEFLERGAISKAQYDKSLHDLTGDGAQAQTALSEDRS